MASKARWYKFTEDGANIGRDSSANNKDLVNYGVTSVTDPVYGKVAYFNGKSHLRLDSVDIPTGMASGKSRTLSLWMKPEGSAGGLVTYGNRVSNGSFGKRYAVNYAGGSGPIEILLFNILPTRTGAGVIATNQWNHVAVVFNDYGNRSQIYINGDLAVSNTKNVATATGHDLYVGWYQEDGDHFVGRMLDMRFYDNALDSASVLGMYNDGPATAVPDISLSITSWGSSSVELEWDALSPGTMYTLTARRNNIVVSTTSTQSTSLVLRDLLPSTEYEFTLSF